MIFPLLALYHHYDIFFYYNVIITISMNSTLISIETHTFQDGIFPLYVLVAIFLDIWPQDSVLSGMRPSIQSLYNRFF